MIVEKMGEIRVEENRVQKVVNDYAVFGKYVRASVACGDDETVRDNEGEDGNSRLPYRGRRTRRNVCGGRRKKTAIVGFRCT